MTVPSASTAIISKITTNNYRVGKKNTILSAGTSAKNRFSLFQTAKTRLTQPRLPLRQNSWCFFVWLHQKFRRRTSLHVDILQVVIHLCSHICLRLRGKGHVPEKGVIIKRALAYGGHHLHAVWVKRSHGGVVGREKKNKELFISEQPKCNNKTWSV